MRVPTRPHKCVVTIAGRKSVGDLTFFSQSSANSGEGGMLEEMCETLILAIVMVLWKGIVEHDDAAWTVGLFRSRCRSTFSLFLR